MRPGQMVPLVNARRVRYLWTARTPAGKLGAGDAWMVPELVTLLGSAEGFDYNQSGQIMTSAYAGMTAGGLREGPYPAALAGGGANVRFAPITDIRANATLPLFDHW